MTRPDHADLLLEAELDALEAQFAEPVRALALTPAPAARAALDARVAEGFASPPRAPRRRPRVSWPPRLAWRPALALAACALLALVVTATALRGGGSGGARDDAASEASGAASPAATSGDTSVQRGGPAPATTPDAGAGTSPSSGTSTAAPPAPQADATIAPVAPGRRVERDASLEVAVPARRIAAAGGDVIGAAQAVGGYVAASQIDSRRPRSTATFTLRVPSARLDDAVARIGRLGRVVAVSQSARDITAAVDGAAARVADVRAERSGLLRALARATSATEVASLRARIADNRATLRAAERSAASLRRRADLATLGVTLTGTGTQAAAPAADDGRWTPGDALRTAGRVLEVAAAVALVALAVGLVAGLPALGAWLASRSLRRRRREAALDAR